ncbi:MAG TPA: AAA family ATPase [Lacipirellulaceae bacterium]|jgi:general secretion pathway protein A|nr:AAA family ATPase [Lacipirellulaceae bacterium]
MNHKQSLPLAFWGLERWPFRGSIGAGQFYPTAGHDEALARIEYLVESRGRVGALLGEPGLGKSLVLRVAAERLTRKGCAAVVVDALGASTREVLWNIACGLRTSPRDDADTSWLWRQIADRVVENRMQQVATVLLVDDAGQAGPDLMTQLVRLARLDTTPAARWTMVLAADASQAGRWNETLRSAVDLRIELGTWSSDETVGYVQTTLVEAGRLEPVFDDEALRSLHELSGGVPRQVARLADYALLAGAAAKTESIGAAIIEAAYDEVAWPTMVEAY